jgi:hypothetical protein
VKECKNYIPLLQHDNENSWSQVAKGKSSRSKKVTPQFTVSISNRFCALKEVVDETLLKKTTRCPEKNVEKNKMLYSDSYGRDLPTLLRGSNDGVLVFGEVRPGAKVKDVVINCVRDCAVLGPKDHVVIMGGANDIARNETKTCINVVKRTLSALTCTNVIVLNIRIRHDLIRESVVNKEIRKANVDINMVCKRFRNVKILGMSNISRASHTRHGLHLNRLGEEYIVQEISKIIGNRKKNLPNVIALGDLKQGN